MYLFSVKRLTLLYDKEKYLFYKLLKYLLIIICILYNIFALIFSPIICLFFIIFYPYLVFSMLCDQLSFWFIERLSFDFNEVKNESKYK